MTAERLVPSGDCCWAAAELKAAATAVVWGGQAETLAFHTPVSIVPGYASDYMPLISYSLYALPGRVELAACAVRDGSASRRVLECGSIRCLFRNRCAQQRFSSGP
jgi:hypothetical protein